MYGLSTGFRTRNCDSSVSSERKVDSSHAYHCYQSREHLLVPLWSPQDHRFVVHHTAIVRVFERAIAVSL